MRIYKHIQFGEGISCTLSEFKKSFASHLKDLSESEVKETYKIATKGNGNAKTTAKKSKEVKSRKD